MRLVPCSICGKFTKAGGLCYEHGKALYDYAEMKYWEMLDEMEEGKYCEEGGDEKQAKD